LFHGAANDDRIEMPTFPGSEWIAGICRGGFYGVPFLQMAVGIKTAAEI
jgi:hypothetical protein